MDTPVLADQSSIHQLCMDTGCRLEDLLRVMSDRDGWQDSQGNPGCWHALMKMINLCIGEFYSR